MRPPPGGRVQNVAWFLGSQTAGEQFHLIPSALGETGAAAVAPGYPGDVAVGFAVAGEDERGDHGHTRFPSGGC
jgi:hypothetical protein